MDPWTPQPVAQIGPEAAVRLLDEGAALIDVREIEEWQTGRAPQAFHVPLGELAARLDELPRDRKLIMVCRSGGRSGTAAAALVDDRFGRPQPCRGDAGVEGGVTARRRRRRVFPARLPEHGRKVHRSAQRRTARATPRRCGARGRGSCVFVSPREADALGRVEVPRVHDGVVGKLREAVDEAVVHGGRVAAGKVRPPATLEEERVAGDEAAVDEEALAARGVARRVQEADRRSRRP